MEKKTIGFPSVNTGLRRSLAPRSVQRSFGLDKSTKFRRNMMADELLFGDTLRGHPQPNRAPAIAGASVSAD
jgi:hypothetical protein